MTGDLYGFAVIGGVIGSLVIIGASGHTNHSDFIEVILSLFAYVIAALALFAVVAMLRGDVLWMVALLLSAIAWSALWLMASLVYFVFVA